MSAPEPLKWRYKPMTPVVVEAMQWTGDNTGAVMEWVGEHLDPATGERVLSFVPLAYPAPKLWSASLEQWHLVRQGDWFIRGLTGFYPLGPNTFAATYEPADKPVRDEAAELRAALEAVWSWLRSEFPAAPDSGDAVEEFAEQIWLTVCTALAASEGQP